MSNEYMAIAILTGLCTVVLWGMIYQTLQVRELYKMFAAKVEEDKEKRK